jgi:hypothetical protein
MKYVMNLAAICLLATAVLAFAAPRAEAVPAFATQTGEPCQACHVGGFGPQLTPFGRQFKIQGYTLRTKDFTVPLSVMAVASYVHTLKPQVPPPADGFHSNDNFALDQLSLFFAGGLGQHLGAFIQGTFDGIAKAWHWDNLDARATDTFTVKGVEVMVGTSLNNAPTVQDPWNTLPAWGYPYTTSSLSPSPGTSPLLNGALAQTTLGATAYAWINTEFYIEGGGYWSPSASALTNLGVDPTSPGSISGVAPYGRVAFQHDIGDGTLEVGAFGMQASIHPGLDRTTGFADRYTDLGVDGSYVDTLSSGDVITLNTRFTHESQSLDATCALAGVSSRCAKNSLDDLRVDASYYWRNKIGLTLGAFGTSGSSNATLYAGSPTFSPNSSGVLVQLDGTPFGAGNSPLGKRFNTRVGVQFTAYSQFDGASHNYDGLGDNAKDNDTFRLFIWTAY